MSSSTRSPGTPASSCRVAYLARSIAPSRTANSVHVMRMADGYHQAGARISLSLPRWSTRHGVEAGVRDLHAFYGISPEIRVRRLPRLGGGTGDTLLMAGLLPLVAVLQRPTFVHTRSIAMAWGVRRLSKATVLLELHGPPPEGGRRRQMLDDFLARPFGKGLVVISERLRTMVAAMLGDSRMPETLVAHDGVDHTWLGCTTPTAEARAALRLPSAPLCLYTGHLYEGRGLDLISSLAKSMPDVHFVIVGGTEIDLATRRRSPTPSNLELRGFCPPNEVLRYLKAADVLLMPYQRRISVSGTGTNTADFASPLKMFEYMASERPIVSSDLPVLREVLEDRRNALLREPGDHEGWALAIRELLSNRALATGVASEARTDVERFTWKARAERLISFATSLSGTSTDDRD
ncbi:MAG: glycosyltransferase [Acidobacteria bacterium]|nr:MAG: glycosyltransferase [Acidobacteriota bacterium]REK04375.1 MAG: glycosyltransferase [Acidobacteriota bacterium]